MVYNNVRPLMLCLIVLIAFLLNSYALEMMGVYYVSVGGSAIFKIHFYSYIVMIFVVLYIARYGIRHYLSSLGEIRKYWILLFFSIIYVIVYGLLRYGTSGMAYVVDTLLTPFLIFPIAMSLNGKQSRFVLYLFTLILFMNCIVAILEYIKQVRIFDYDFEAYQHYFRSTAFFSHPLNNALISAFLALFLYSFNKVNPLIVFILVVVAIFSFGARVASAVFILLSFVSLYLIYFRISYGISRQSLILLKLSLLVGLLSLFYAIYYLDFGIRIFENLTIDNSAQSRFDVFFIFSFLSFEEILFGANPDIFENLSDYIDNSIIENFVVVWLMFYGVIGAIPLVLCFYVFMAKLFFVSTSLQRISILSFVIISITNNSLASKNPALLYFLICYAAAYNFIEKRR